MNNRPVGSALDRNRILACGISLHQSGQLKRAGECYRQVLEAEPENPRVLHLTGLLAHQQGQSQRAAELLRTAIRHDSKNPYYLNDLGTILEDLGCMAEALDCYRRALAISPEYFEAANNVGNVFYKLNRLEEALAWYQKTLSLQPGYAEGYVNIGNIAHERGQLAEAINWYQKALKLNPGLVAGHHHLGLVYKDQGRYREAVACYQQALALAPECAETLCSLGNVLRSLGHPTQAASCYYEAIQHQPAFPEAYTNLGSTLRDLGNLDEAFVCFQKALRLKPDLAETHNNMGNVLRDKGDLEQAAGCYRQAVRLKDDLVEAHFNLGSVNIKLGKLKSAIQSIHKAIVLKPDYSKALNQLVFQMLQGCYWKELGEFTCQLDRLTTQELERGLKSGETPFVSVSRRADPAINFAIASSWSRHISKTAAGLKKDYIFKGLASKRSRIRIGYLSADFRNHPIAHLILGLFGYHSRDKFEIFCYSHGKDDGSNYRKRIQAECDKFIDLIDRSEGDCADQIFEDRVDILVDLMGYTQDHRLSVSALRPAPVQVSFLGFPGTTGAEFFDYIIADRIVIPEQHKPFYSEKIVYMPHCYQVNDDTQAIAPGRPLGAAHGLPEDGLVFCAFHQSFKIDPIMFKTWMNILTRVPGSVLWLLKNNDDAEQNLKMAAQNRGIDPLRLVFAPRLPKDQHLARHRLADIMLDTRIYNGHTTTSDALWAGVPVIAMMGSHFASRVSASILTALGMIELITRTLDEYENLAVQLAFDSAKLKMLRRKIAINKLTFPLFDTRRYVRNLEKAFIQMRQIYAADQNPKPIEVYED